MGDIVTNSKFRSRRMGSNATSNDMNVVDELETAISLIHAAIMAASHIEDMEDRNGFVALLDTISTKVQACAKQLKRKR